MSSGHSPTSCDEIDRLFRTLPRVRVSRLTDESKSESTETNDSDETTTEERC